MKLITMFLPFVYSFVPGANLIIRNDMYIFNSVLAETHLPCHLCSARVKTFESARAKLSRFSTREQDIFKLYDLVGFRFVFYNKDDLFKFYHGVKMKKLVTKVDNYFKEPKDNGYKAFHFHYRNQLPDCPIDNIECQLFTVKTYYDSIYGNSSNYKDYLIINSDLD